MIEKQETYTKIELLETGYVQLRKTTKIIEDDEIISQTHHRHVRKPGDTLDDLPTHISSSISEFWHTDLIQAFEAMVSSSIQ